MEAIKIHLLTTTNWQVRSFLGIVEYCWKGISHLATLAAPLTDLTRKKSSNKINTILRCELAFQEVKLVSRDQVVLMSLDFFQTFGVEFQCHGS